MAQAEGFWSYVHADDDAEGGRIVQLAEDLVTQFEMLTGEDIDLFLDRDSLEWGDVWRAKVDGSLASVAFFIPVVTPRYFKSAECRRELNFFARRAEQLGIKDLVMPILYAPVPELNDDPPSDDLMVLIKDFQWEDWTQLRFAERTAGDYRQMVAKMASRLAAANVAAEQSTATQNAIEIAAAEDETDTAPGIIDRMAQAEEVIPAWGDTITAIGQEIVQIGELLQDATGEMEAGAAKGKGLAARLTVLRHVAKDLEAPANKVQQLGHQFASQLHDVDQGIRTIIEIAPAQLESDGDRSEVCDFFRTVREMVDSADEGLGALQGMIDAIKPILSMSRDLRAPMRKLGGGLTLMTEGREVMREWLELIDRSGVECPDTP
jgi:TIR domain